MWIARDKNGELYMYSSKPIVLGDGHWFQEEDVCLFLEIDDDYDKVNIAAVELNGDAFPDVTFENSPRELVLK